MSTLKALTLTQPWATLVAIGQKRIETRSWSTPHRGLIAIHAAKGFPRDCRALCFDPPFRDVLYKGGALYPDAELGLSEERFLMPRGAIVAIARLVDVCPTGDVLNYVGRGALSYLGSPVAFTLTEQEAAFGDYTGGRFAWLLADVRPLPEPLQCKGARRLWTVPDDVASQIDRTINRARVDALHRDAAENEAKRTLVDENARTPAQ
jgi:hypothetical protein